MSEFINKLLLASILFSRLRFNLPIKGVFLINVLFINVDINDSLNKIKRYVEYFDSSFIGIKLEEDDLIRVTKNAGVYYKKISTEDGVDFFDHTGAIFLLDKNSKIMGIYTPPLIVDSLKDDILYGLK